MAIRVGLIGLNYGAQIHLPAYANSGRYDLVAVCARTPGRAETVAREHNIPRWYTDARDLIHSDLDLARRWFGPVREVEASLAALTAVPTLPPGISPADDTGVVTLHFESGQLATYSYSAATALRRNTIELHGAEASFLIETYGEELLLLPMDADKPRRVYTPAEYLEDTRGQNGFLGGF